MKKGPKTHVELICYWCHSLRLLLSDSVNQIRVTMDIYSIPQLDEKKEVSNKN